MSDIFDTKNSQESENHAKGIEIGDEKYTKGDEIKSFENKVIQEKFNPITKEIKSICGNDERFEQLDLYKESGMTENDAIYKIGSEIYSDKIDEVTSILTEVFKEIIDISEDFKADCKKIYDSDLIASDKVKAVIDIMGKDEFKEKLSENEKLDFDKIADKIGGINIDLIEQLDSKLKNYESTKSDLEKLTDKFDKHLENYVNKTDFRSNNIFKAFDKFKVDCDAHKLKIEVNGKIPSRTDLVLDFISFVRCNIFESVIESALRGIFDTKPETDKVELSETEKNDISSSDSANKTDITSSDTEAVKEQLEVKVSEQNVEKSQTIEKRETILDNGTIMRGFSPNEIDKIKMENPRAGEMYGMDMLSAAKDGYIDKQGNEIIPAKTDRFAVAGISSDDTNKKYEVEIKLRNGETKTVKASPMNGYLAVDKESGNTYLLNHKLEVIEPINVVDNSKVLNNGDKIECRGKGAEIQASNIHFERYPDSVKSVAEIKDAIAKNDLSNVKEYISEAKEGIENVKEFKNELTEYKNVIEKTDNIDIQRKEKALSEINSNIEKCDVQISKYNTFIEKSEAFVKEPTFNNLQEVENSKTGFSHERFDAGIGMESRQTLIECNKINAETDQSIEKDQINNTETEKDEDKSAPTVDAEEQTNPDDSAKDETEPKSPVGTEEQANPDASAKDETEPKSPVGTEEQTNPDDSAKDETEQSSPVGTEEQANPDASTKDEIEQSSPVGTEEQTNPDASAKDETETVPTNNAKTDNKIEIDENYLKNDFPADLKADFEKYLSDDKMSFLEDIIDKYSQCFGIDETKSYEIMYDTFGKVLSEHKEDLSNPRMTDLGTDIMVCDKCSFMEAKDKIETLMFELPISFNQKEDYFKNQFNKLETNIEIMQTRSDMSIFRFEYIDRNNEEHEVTIADNGYMDTNKDNIDTIDKQLFADVIDEKNADIHPLTLDSLKEAVVNIIAECYGNEVSKVFENVIDKLDTSELTGDIRPMIIKLGIAIDTVPDMVFKSEEKIENISSAEFMDKCVDKAQSDIDSISNNFLPGMWTFPYGSIDSRENQMDLQTAELENDRDEDPPERDAYDPVGYND